MSEGDLRSFFAYVREILHINLGFFCDRNQIFRSDFTNFMKGKKYYTSLYELDLMRIDVLNHVKHFMELYTEVA